jgi:hypothetical protein
MNLEQVKGKIAENRYSSEELVSMSGMTLEEINQLKSPPPPPAPKPKPAPVVKKEPAPAPKPVETPAEQ